MPRTRPEKGQPILITVGDSVLEIFFPMGVLKELDREHGISLLKGATFGEVMQSPEKLALLLYYGLKTKQPDITQEWVDNHVAASMLLDLSPYIMFAMTGRWSRDLVQKLEEGDDEEETPNLPARSAQTPPANGLTLPATGSPSGQPDDTSLDLPTAKSGR